MVEQRQADRRPYLSSLEGRGRPDEVEEEVKVCGFQPSVLHDHLLLNDGDEHVIGDKNGENQIRGDGFLQDTTQSVSWGGC